MWMNHVDKPNSVPSEDGDNHLSGSDITTTLERHFSTVNSRDTALHAGKDLAVSLLRFHKILPEGSLCFSARASLLAPLATHSVDATGVTRYHSRASRGYRCSKCSRCSNWIFHLEHYNNFNIYNCAKRAFVFGLSSLLSQSDCLTWLSITIARFSKKVHFLSTTQTLTVY